VFTSTCAASDSTWLKSGFRVASAVHPLRNTYFMPSEGDAVTRSFSKECGSAESSSRPAWEATSDGRISSVPPARIPSIPSITPSWQSMQGLFWLKTAHESKCRLDRG
jgi:hypothetical protein